MRHAIKSGLSLLFVVTALATPGHGPGRHGSRSDTIAATTATVTRIAATRLDRRDDRYDDRRHRHDRDYGITATTVAATAITVRRRRVVYRPAYRPAYHPGYGPPRWARGGRYYDRGYGPTYVVRDYCDYGLRAPPRGYYWRRSDAGDFLLVALATGIIADLILGH